MIPPMETITALDAPADFALCPACERNRLRRIADELCPDCAEWLDAAVALKVEADRAATYSDDEGLCIAAGINPGKF